jgi:long-chain acyl-CoA synthetase
MVTASPHADDPTAARRFVGLDECEIASMGSAPIPAELIEWFGKLGIPISEAYGLSEATGMVAWDPFEMRAGRVGRPVPGVDVRLDVDGEILVRGGNVFPGYLHDPEQTAAVVDADGWLRTGDIGTFDADGYLSIVDRKKDIIITAGGKNVSPANIEALLRACPLVDQACVLGDGRPYLVALVVPDVVAATAFGREHGVTVDAAAQVAADPVLRAELDRAVAAVNERLSRPEQVKRILVLPDEWTPGSGLLTPTFKIRRAEIARRYRDEVAALYDAG